MGPQCTGRMDIIRRDSGPWQEGEDPGGATEVELAIVSSRGGPYEDGAVGPAIAL